MIEVAIMPYQITFKDKEIKDFNVLLDENSYNKCLKDIE